jgi:hypothetical protein
MREQVRRNMLRLVTHDSRLDRLAAALRGEVV